MPQSSSGKELLTDQQILSQFPYPVAIGYDRILKASKPQAIVNRCFDLFNFGMRTITLGILSEYLTRDMKIIIDVKLNYLIRNKLRQANPTIWIKMFEALMNAYENERSLFFVTELYDLYWYWDTHAGRLRVRKQFTELLEQIRDKYYEYTFVWEQRPDEYDVDWWNNLATDLTIQIKELIECFAFLQHYDLIQVVAEEDKSYRYLDYRGTLPVLGTVPIPLSADLEPGSFYISKQKRDFLMLSPLLIYWQEQRSVDAYLHDVALYETHNEIAVVYLTILSGRISLPERRQEVRRLLRALEEKEPPPSTLPLSWENLRASLQQTSDQRLRDVRVELEKLFVQRQHIRNILDDFLKSPARCVVVLGGAGSGKTTLTLSLIKELNDDPDTCCLFYHGAVLDSEKPIEQTISDDLGALFEVPSPDESVPLFPSQFNRILSRGNRRMVLIIDAVNEHPNTADLIYRLNQFFSRSHESWLKIIVTSRPQSWRVSTRDLHLSPEKYYRYGSSADSWVELDPFTVEELEEGFFKYKSEYGFEAEFRTLNPTVRRALQSPLALRLFSKAAQTGSVTRGFSMIEVYDVYVEEMIRSRRLEEADIYEFLMVKIIPRLVMEPFGKAKDEFKSFLKKSDIDTATTPDDRPTLRDLIIDNTRLRSGRRVNQHYINLVDAEILTMRMRGPVYEIAFKVEAAFDYFVGTYLYEKRQESGQWLDFFIDMAEKIETQPFLWGVVFTVLQRWLGKLGDLDEVIDLANSDHVILEDLLVTALTEYGKGHQERVGGFLDSLFKTTKRRFWSSLARQARAKNAREVVIKVAYGLLAAGVESPSVDKLTALLGKIALDRDRDLRATANRYVYYLSKAEPHGLEYSKEVLNHMIEEFIRERKFLPNRNLLFALLSTSLLLAMESLAGRTDRTLFDEMVVIWKKAFQRLLRADLQDSIAARVAPVFRNQIIRIGTSVLVSYLSLPVPSRGRQEAGHANAREVSTFFNLSQFEREEWARLAMHLDPNPKDLTEIGPIVVSKYKTLEGMYIYLCNGMLMLKGYHDPMTALPIIRQVFHSDQGEGLLHFSAMFVWYGIARRFSQADEEWLMAGEEFVREALNESRKPYGHCTSNLKFNYKYYPLNYYMAVYSRWHRGRIPLLDEYIQQALTKADSDLLLHLIDSVGDFRGDLLDYSGALESLRDLMNSNSEDVKKHLINTLARIRGAYPDQIDRFLISSNARDALIREVTRQSTQHSYFFLARGIPQFIVDVLAILSPEQWQTFHKYVLEISRCSTFKESMRLIVKAFSNEMCGTELFQL